MPRSIATTEGSDLVGRDLSSSLRRYFFTSFLLESSSWTLSANSAARSSFSAPSSSLSAFFFTSAENSPCASAAFPATSSIAANTPPSISPSSPALSSAPRSHSSSGFLNISANNRVFSFTSFISLTSSTSFFDMELRPNKRLDPFFSRQSQTYQFPLAFQIDVEIKKRAALAFRRHPLRQFGQRNVSRAVVKLVALLRLHDLLPRCQQFLAQLFVPRTLLRRQRLDVAIELALHRCHLPLRPYDDR